MVKFYTAPLDRTFAALSDATRRALVMRLAQQPGLSVSELATPYPMSLPAVMKHLDVLSDAGLIRRNKTGRIVACELTPEPMETAMNWLNGYLRFWSEQLNHLAALMEKESCPPKPKSLPSEASPSNVVSMRPPKGSTPRGRNLKN